MPSFNRQPDRGARLFEEIIHSPSLVALWPMNEKSGTIFDRGPNRLDGTVSGNPTYSKAIGPTYGLDLDGTGDYVTVAAAGVASALDFERTSSFSMLAILDPNISAIGSIIGKRNDGGDEEGWSWQLSATGVPIVTLQATAANRVVVTSNAALANGVDVMLGFSYAGTSAATGVVLYKNGAVDADTDTATPIDASILSTSFGVSIGRIDAAFDFNGDIGFVAVWNKVVSAEDMRRYAFLAGFL